MKTITIEGRSVGKSTDLGASILTWDPEKIIDPSEVRRQFIERFPRLAPLMYSLHPLSEPITIEGWLTLMQHELDHAHASMRDNVAFDLAINEAMEP